jgi:hypothetical protein
VNRPSRGAFTLLIAGGTLFGSVHVVEAQPAAGTSFDHDGLTFALPGAWSEQPAQGGGWELQRGGNEQLLVSLAPPIGGLDVASSAQRMSAAQEQALRTLCKSGYKTSTIPTTAAATTPSFRFRVSCEMPKLVATFFAGAATGRVVSIEHYGYRSVTMAALDSVDGGIVASMRVKEPDSCPTSVVDSAKQGEGICVEPAVLGNAAAAACGKLFEQRGYVRDEVTARGIEAQTGKKVACYRKKP